MTEIGAISRFVVVLGLVISSVAAGSLASVLIDRLPAARSAGLTRSCWRNLTPRNLAPIISFSPIGLRHLLVEIAALLIAIWAYGSSSSVVNCWTNCLLGWTLLPLAWIDVEHFRLPDVLTLPLLGVGLVAARIASPDVLHDHLIGAAMGYAAFRVLGSAYRILRKKDGLGHGDAKLLGVAGAWLGWAALPDVVFGAALLGIGWIACRTLFCHQTRAATRMPFGPSLAIAIWIVRLYGQRLIGIEGM